MLKTLAGIFVVVNVFCMHCCIVVGKQADEDMERMFQRKSQDFRGKQTSENGCGYKTDAE